MPKQNAIDKAVAVLEGEIAVLQLAVRKLKDQQVVIKLGKCAVKAAAQPRAVVKDEQAS